MVNFRHKFNIHLTCFSSVCTTNTPITTTTPSVSRATRSASTSYTRRKIRRGIGHCATGRRCCHIEVLCNRISIANDYMEERIDHCKTFVSNITMAVCVFLERVNDKSVSAIFPFRLIPIKAASNSHLTVTCKSSKYTNRIVALMCAWLIMVWELRSNVKSN